MTTDPIRLIRRYRVKYAQTPKPNPHAKSESGGGGQSKLPAGKSIHPSSGIREPAGGPPAALVFRKDLRERQTLSDSKSEYAAMLDEKSEPPIWRRVLWRPAPHELFGAHAGWRIGLKVGERQRDRFAELMTRPLQRAIDVCDDLERLIRDYQTNRAASSFLEAIRTREGALTQLIQHETLPDALKPELRAILANYPMIYDSNRVYRAARSVIDSSLREGAKRLSIDDVVARAKTQLEYQAGATKPAINRNVRFLKKVVGGNVEQMVTDPFGFASLRIKLDQRRNAAMAHFRDAAPAVIGIVGSVLGYGLARLTPLIREMPEEFGNK